ncbi:BZ3500_MvSof-1268-A1-R1_Chr6-2g08606 [Microbotryum saponariae]|uniref:Carboxylic ester hydrolase n=1 Tax=Microbotryum saponariae TaxID=289078 RepID=A0A2X0KIT6_9BASI|nr:BZ3500_MvSof-1268-A1-R1_Chr6-2g08606 [Microbotryum saponariae]SDA07878.1 BZ3501_MvSof-1269-A2-R1_Chr6-1g08315 [Microbotryum saponariae]
MLSKLGSPYPLWQLICFFSLLSRCRARPLSFATAVTSKGRVLGHQGRLANRWTIPFAKAPVDSLRFSDPVSRVTLAKWVTSFIQSNIYGPIELTSGFCLYSSHDATSIPPACPQPRATTATSEDCLFLTVYSPKGATSSSKLPVMFWTGSSTAFGLDGSDIASNQNMVVVVPQYRLGILGWMGNSNLSVAGNYGLKDVILALRFVRAEITAFGGDSSRITLAGESSGAEIVKSLLVTPSVFSMYARAILHSAPLDFSDFSPALADTIGAMTVSRLNCSSMTCLRNATIEHILSVQADMNNEGQKGALDGVREVEPVYRTIVDGTLVQNEFGDTAAQGIGTIRSRVAKKIILLTTMKDEGAFTVAEIFPSTASPAYFPMVIERFFPERAAAILGSGLYDPSLLPNDDDALRDQFSRVGTDFVFTCATQQVALNLTRAGYQIYLGQFDLGVSYYNDTAPYLIGKATHQDDIGLVFHPNSIILTRAQRALTSEVQTRWGAFVRGASPNANGYKTWSPIANEANLNLLELGSNAHYGLSNISKTQRPAVCSLSSGIWSRV